MAQQVIFDYTSSRKVSDIVVFVALAFFQIFWLTLVAMLVLSVIFTGFFSINLPDVTPFLIFFIFIIIKTVSSVKNGLRKLTITSESICWETLLRKVYTLKREEIAKIEWQPNQIVLNQRLTIHTSSLPKKHKVLFNAALLNWVPQDASPPLLFRQYQDNRIADTGMDDQPVCSETGKFGRFLLYGMGIGVVFTFITLSMTVRNIALNQERILIFLFLGSFVLALLLGVWLVSVHRVIQVSDAGITYQKGRKSYAYQWHEIEAIAVEDRLKRFLIWENDKQKSLSYLFMKPERVDEVEYAIFQKAIGNDVPFGIV